MPGSPASGSAGTDLNNSTQKKRPRVLSPLLAKLDMMEDFRETLPYALKIYTNEAVFAYRDGYQAALSVLGRLPARRETYRRGGKSEKETKRTKTLKYTACEV